MPLYDRGAAVEYAVKYAITPNPDYPPFPNDCTSFVSQAMLAGGWTMVGGSFGDRKDDDAWWWGKSWAAQASYTWGGAHNFSKFLTKSGRATACTRFDLALGDVVQISDSTGHVFHSMIVTSGPFGCTNEGDGPKVSYHSNNTLNKFLSDVEAALPTSRGNSYLYWKIARSFT